MSTLTDLSLPKWLWLEKRVAEVGELELLVWRDLFERDPLFSVALPRMMKNHFFISRKEDDNQLQVRQYFGKKDRAPLFTVIRITEKGEGIPGIAHGGLVAAVLDHTSVTCRWLHNDHYIGMWLTASLDVIYKRPILVDNIYVLESYLEKIDDRKIRVITKGRGINGDVCVEGTALLVLRKEPLDLKPNL